MRWDLITINNSNQQQKEKTMALNVKPLGDRILCEAVEEKETKKGGIIIPDSAKEKPTECIVIALGTGKTDDNGKKVPFEVKKGDRVLVSKYLSLIHISEPTRQAEISYAVFCLKKK